MCIIGTWTATCMLQVDLPLVLQCSLMSPKNGRESCAYKFVQQINSYCPVQCRTS